MKVIVKMLLKFMIKVLLPLGIFAAVVNALEELLAGLDDEATTAGPEATTIA